MREVGGMKVRGAKPSAVCAKYTCNVQDSCVWLDPTLKKAGVSCQIFGEPRFIG